MSELGSIRFKDQFQMLIPKSDFCDGPHTAPPLRSAEGSIKRDLFGIVFGTAIVRTAEPTSTSSVYQLTMLRNTWGNYFIVLTLKTLDVCFPPCFAGFFLWCQWGPLVSWADLTHGFPLECMVLVCSYQLLCQGLRTMHFSQTQIFWLIVSQVMPELLANKSI